MLPDDRFTANHKSLEEVLWSFIPKELRGKVLNDIDELKAVLPKKFKDVELKVGEFDRYSAKDAIFSHPIAYGCPHCKKIVVDTPIMEIENSIDILSGRESLHYSCANCNKEMYEAVFRQS